MTLCKCTCEYVISADLQLHMQLVKEIFMLDWFSPADSRILLSLLICSPAPYRVIKTEKKDWE